MNSILIVEEHQEMRSALRDWLHASVAPVMLSEARRLQEALGLTGAIEAGAIAFVSKRELPHGLLPILGRLAR